MKFFKHFTDATRGNSMQYLFEKMGHVGIACYWILVEMCAEKLDKKASEEFTESHCNFSFHEKILRQNLRLSRVKLEIFLGFSSDISLLFFKKIESIYVIEMPKLLESLDRDSKRARTERVSTAPKKKNKIKKEDKELDKDKEEECFFDFEIPYSFYPLKKGKAEAFTRLEKQITSQEEFSSFCQAVKNYAEECRINETSQNYIKHFSSFVGSRELKPWKDFVDFIPQDRRPTKTNFNKADQRTANNRAAAEAYLKKLEGEA